MIITRLFVSRWVLGCVAAVLIGTGLIFAAIMFSPPVPDWVADGIIGLCLGVPLGLFQGRQVRRLGRSGASLAIAVAAATTLGAMIVQGPLEETGWGFVPEGAAHAAVLGLLLGAAQLAALRGLVPPVAWMGAALAIAFLGEMTGRLVGLVGPEPLNLVLDFVLWHSLIGAALIWMARPGYRAAARQRWRELGLSGTRSARGAGGRPADRSRPA